MAEFFDPKCPLSAAVRVYERKYTLGIGTAHCVLAMKPRRREADGPIGAPSSPCSWLWSKPRAGSMLGQGAPSRAELDTGIVDQ
jgi:hypothetical protein